MELVQRDVDVLQGSSLPGTLRVAISDVSCCNIFNPNSVHFKLFSQFMPNELLF